MPPSPLAVLLLAAALPVRAAAVALRVPSSSARGARGAAGDSGRGSSSSATRRSNSTHTRAEPGAEPGGVYYVAELLDKLKVFAHDEDEAAQQRFQSEQERLSAAVQLTKAGTPERAAMDKALSYNSEDRVETQVAVTEMLEYYYTAKAMLGSHSTAPDCRFLACGEHAACKTVGSRAQCQCDACHEGDGYTCRPVPCTPATLGASRPVRGPPPAGYGALAAGQAPGQVGEVQLTVFGKDQIAVVLRDVSAGNLASLVVGRTKDMEVEFGFRQLLSPSAAFGLVVAGLPNGRLVVGFRDAARGGVGQVMGGHAEAAAIGAAGGGGGALQAKLSAPQPLARGQDERMALVALSSSRVVVLYSEHTEGKDGALERAWGSAALVEVLPGGALRVYGKYHFSQGFHVTQLSGVALSPTAMVAAFRATPLPSQPSGQESRELSALWIGMAGDELAVDPHPIGLEPGRARMLARDVALVSQDTFAYSYESAGQKTAKMAVVRVDPETHRMSIIGGPQVLARGAVNFLRAVSLPSGPMSPMTFTMFQTPHDRCKAEVCRVSPEGRVADCKDVSWADRELAEVSGGRLSDGRLALAFVDMKGTLEYQLLSAQETGAMG